ncbi:MAG: hypothetical protein P8X96_07390 [Desulfobacteraceae bacterium]
MSEVIVVPDIGEGVVSGKVVAVHIKKGDTVEVDDTVIELETDKALVEIPSTVRGVVVEVMTREGEELKVGDAIASVDIDGDVEQPPEEASRQAPPAEDSIQTVKAEDESAAPAKAQPEVKPEVQTPAMENAPPLTPVPASPTIRRMAREAGLLPAKPTQNRLCQTFLDGARLISGAWRPCGASRRRAPRPHGRPFPTLPNSIRPTSPT